MCHSRITRRNFHTLPNKSFGVGRRILRAHDSPATREAAS